MERIIRLVQERAESKARTQMAWELGGKDIEVGTKNSSTSVITPREITKQSQAAASEAWEPEAALDLSRSEAANTPVAVQNVGVPPVDITGAAEVKEESAVISESKKSTTNSLAKSPAVAHKFAAPANGQQKSPEPTSKLAAEHHNTPIKDKPMLTRKSVSAPAVIAGWKRSKKILVLGILLGVAFLSVLAYRHGHSQPADPNKELIAEVAKVAILPKGERPLVSTVIDKNKASQTFLANSADGDKVLLYVQSGRAILYRPSSHQIVNMGPLAQPPAQVFLCNGTSDNQATAGVRRKLDQPSAYTIV